MESKIEEPQSYSDWMKYCKEPPFKCKDFESVQAYFSAKAKFKVTCPWCNKVYSRSSMNDHTIRTHMNQEDENVKNYRSFKNEYKKARYYRKRENGN